MYIGKDGFFETLYSLSLERPKNKKGALLSQAISCVQHLGELSTAPTGQLLLPALVPG